MPPLSPARAPKRWFNTVAEQDARDGKDIARLYTASLMSNTKWRKLFAALEAPELGLNVGVFKFVGAEKEWWMNLPSGRSMSRTHVDCGEVGPYTLKAIEWLELPYEIPTGTASYRGAFQGTRQDTEQARQRLFAIGKFMTEEGQRGLRIIGHVRA